VCYTTVYRGINSLTLTYTTRDSCITYKYIAEVNPITVYPSRNVSAVRMVAHKTDDLRGAHLKKDSVGL